MQRPARSGTPGALVPESTGVRPAALPVVDRAGREAAWLGRLMVLPVVFFVGGLVVYPLIRGLQTSLSSSTLYGGTSHFVGLSNYSDVVHDPEAVSAILHTLVYLGMAVSLEVMLGLFVAVTLQRLFPGRGVVLAILILPWALPSVVSGVLWRRIFDPDSGLLNSALLHLHLIHHPHVWMAGGALAILFITLVHVWGVLPLVSLIFLAGLQGIPEEVYGASEVDGAGPLRQFRHITMPLLRPSLVVALLVGTLQAIGIFDEIYVLNGTALNTNSILIEVYSKTFADADFAHGTAFAFLLAGVSILIGAFYAVVLRVRGAP